ncbi:MAG TPA: hypothetical protein VKF81_14220 [Blastocatellia bacterium]|nr:hypothetical protein [Blastocatellia bacterium]
MTKKISFAITSSLRKLRHGWRTLIILFVLYLAMLGAVYWFIATREATIAQLLLSLLLVIAAPVLFFVIQTMAARYRDRGEHVWALLGSSLRDFWKLLVIALPLIVIAVLAVYLFGKLGGNPPAKTVREAVRALPAAQRAVAPKPQPVSWQTIAIMTVQYLLFCLVLPLAAIQLWIATARDGLRQTFKAFPRILARAFTPQAVVTYAIGFVFFAVVPYFLVVPTTHLAKPWLEAGLLALRLVLAVFFSLIGWVVTVGALGELSYTSRTVSAAQPSQGTDHVPAEA